MSQVRGSLENARPVQVVFDVVADQRNEPAYNPNMTAATKVTPGPIGVGTRFKANVMTVAVRVVLEPASLGHDGNGAFVVGVLP